ncbi:MAG: FapA family protein [Lachnospiraceae bacterium]|nr:FapA family protein [Lachnospiraceae bacterium]
MVYKHSFFQLVHKEDGTYIKVYPAMNGGNPLTFEIVSRYLDAKKITDYNSRAINEVISTATEPTEVKVSVQKILPQSEYLDVAISLDRSKAIGIFYPPSNKGKLIDKNDIISDLHMAGVKYGIAETVIDKYLAHRQFCTPVLLAKEKPVKEGRSASIKYNFNLNIDSKPKMNEDGSVDFHHLDMINNVNEGDILAELTPAVMGEPGKDVCGNPIMPKKVVKKILKHGKNIHLSEDGTKMYSEVNGHVSLGGDRVFVSNVYEVPADVSVASGDIEYDGDVTVRGNVVTGFKVEAKGDIIVDGVVEGATLIAGGQIILKRGIQGMGRGHLEAGGNVIAKFIESAEVKSGGSVTSDAIMHSTIIAKGDIDVGGKRGMIAGGSVKSGTAISARILGSNMGTQTLVEIGVDDEKQAELHQIESDLKELATELESNIKVFTMFRNKMQKGDDLKPDQKRNFLMAKGKIEKLDAERKEKMERQLILKKEIENYQAGRVKVNGVTYPGVKVTIMNVSCFIKEEIVHSQFVKDKGDVRVMSL